MGFRINFLIGMVSLSLILLLSNSVQAANPSCSPSFNVINQDPSPATPDSYVKLVFEISNLEDCNDGFSVKMVPEYPFSLDPGVDPVQTLSGYPLTSSGFKPTWTVAYKVRVAQDAIEGDYPIKLAYHESSSQSLEFISSYQDYNVRIVDSQTTFDIVVQDSSSTQTSLGIVNTGKNTANSLIVKIPQQENYRTTGTSEQIVGNLAAGDYTITSFNLIQKMNRNNTGQGFNTQSEGQVLKVQIDYTDGIGERRSVIKDVQLNLASLSSNVTRMLGQFNRSTTNSKSGLSLIWYVIGGLLIVGILAIIYNKDRIFSKRTHEKNSKEAPDWVSSERASKKK